MTVSVIIPNYNHAPFLVQRIESVLNQTFQDFEVIILDDCSTDNSRDIIEQYRSHPKVSQIVYNDFNSGNTFKQWQKGVELAKGEWVWIAESDDYCEQSFLQELLPKYDEVNNNLVLSYCGSLMYSNNKIISYPHIGYLYAIETGLNFVKSKMIQGNNIYNASMCIFKKSACSNLNEILELVFCGDWLLWIKIAQKGNVKISGKCLNYFRKHSLDVSGKKFSDGTFHKEYIKIQNYLLYNGIISKNIYNKNVYKEFCSIKKHITSKKDRKLIFKMYKEILGFDLFFFQLRRIFISKLILIKKIFSNEC